MRLELRAAGRSFLTWWGCELVGALPTWLQRTLFPERSRLEATVEGENLRLVLLDGGKRRPIAHLPEVAARPPQGRMARKIRRFAGNASEVVLRLPRDRVLRPMLQLPVDAAERLEDVLAVEMDRHTPFASDEVFYDWRVRGSDAELERLFVDLLVARRADVERALKMAAEAGLEPDRLDGEDDGRGPHFNLLSGSRPTRRQAETRLFMALAAATVVLAVVLALVSFERRESELAAVQAEVAALQPAANEVAALESRIRHLQAARTFLDRKKRETPSALAVLAEVTEALPDGDWLISYVHGNGTLRIDGQSADASNLLKRLEASRLLSAVSFGAPVRHDAAAGADQFSIVASVERQGEPE